MINWQVIGQLVATGAIMLSGPVVIVLLALKKAKIPESQIPTHKNFLMSKVMEGLNKVKTGAGVSATVGGVSGAD